MTIYVSNIGCRVSGADLYQLFAVIGNVASAHILTDEEAGQGLRYGFVEMTDEKSAGEVISRLHGKVIKGSALSVARCQTTHTGAARLPVQAPALYSQALV